MSDHTAISLRNLGKTYRVWKNPEARLSSAFWTLLGQPHKTRDLYADVHALAGVTLDVPKGQSLGVIGLNGSGKSTLLQMIAGTLRPSSGEVVVRGRVAALLELGAGFNPDFTGRENVYLNAAVLGLSKEEIDACFADIAEFAEIGEFIERPVKTYSSGMYVRLAFAVLTQVKPDILIIDEALAVGDFVFQQKCFDAMRRFRESGVTFIFVSHGMGMVLELCNRAVVLERGRVLFDGPTPQAVAVYEETAVRARYGGTAQAPATPKPGETATRQGGAPEALPRDYSLASNVDQAALRAEPGSIHSPKAGLLFAKFLNASFAESAFFRTGETLVISLGFQVHEALAEPHIGFKIRDKLGRVIFETSSLCMRTNPAPVHAGEVIVGNFSLPLNLIAGEYSLVVGFAEGSVGDRDYREALFYVQQVRIFTVVANPADILWDGICHLHPKFGWSILPQSSRA